MRAILAALALAALATSAAAKPPSAAPITMGAIKARWFYYHTGELSRDILAEDGTYSGWNTVIGEGPAGEPADDLLVLVPVRTSGEQFSDVVLDVTVKGEKGKLVGHRKFAGILTGASGLAEMPLWLNDVGCAGPITIEARLGKQRRTATLTLACGE